MAHESLALVRLKSQTGLPADTVEMQFAFDNASENGGSGPTAVSVVEAFLNDNPSTDGTVSSLLAGSLDHGAGAVEIDVYNISGALGGGPHGSPIATATTTLSTPSVDTDLPLQAAIGLSYHADLSTVPEFGTHVTDLPTPELAQDFGAPATHGGTSRPKAQRRGRIFLGPLNEAAMSSSPLRIREPDPTATTIFIAALEAMMGSGAGWSVWSRRTATLHHVTGGFIAHETDVVRRRRRKATFRTLWP